MCEFCTMEELDNCNVVGSAGIDVGKLKNNLLMTTCLLKINDEYTLFTDLLDINGTEIASYTIPVKYCPVCGKKLNNNLDENDATIREPYDDLKALRKSLGYNQQDIAKIMGISRYTIINMEQGIILKDSTLQYYKETLGKLQHK